MSNTDNYQEFLRGNPEGIKPIYTINKKILSAYGRKFTSDKETINDAVSNAFVRLLGQIGTFKTPKHIQNYLYMAVREYLRKENKIARWTDSLQEREENTADPFALEKIDDFDLDRLVALKEAKLRQKLEQLPRHRREDFRAYYYESKSIEQIARERRRSQDAVRRNIKLAAIILDKYLNDKGLGRIRLFLLFPFF